MSVTPDDGRTHWHGCEREHGHHACALAELARLRAELERVSAERARHESSIRAMVAWLDQHQPDVWHRGIWDAINSALAQEPPA